MDKKSRFAWLELSPTVAWLCFMVFPLLYQLPPSGSKEISIQLVCVLFVLLVFFACDALALVKVQGSGALIDRFNTTILLNNKKIIYFFAIALFLLSITNLIMMPKIPFVQWLMGTGRDTVEMANSRMLATKSLPAPRVLLYLFNWALLFVTPLLIVMLARERKIFFSFFVFLWAFLYGMITMARLPAMFMCFNLMYSFCFSYQRFRITITRFVFLLLVLFSVVTLAELVINREALNTNDQYAYSMKYDVQDPRFHNTVADRVRILGSPSAQNSSMLDVFEERLRYLVYRMWLTPADVSMRWYQYYTIHDYAGWASVLSTSGGDAAPSRTVGVWGYVDKFPQFYLSSINAYASFDADAFSRGGIISVVFATLALGLCRLLLFFLRGGSVTSAAAYGVGIALLTVLPIQASVQAILAAHGLIVVVFMVGFLNLCQRRI